MARAPPSARSPSIPRMRAPLARPHDAARNLPVEPTPPQRRPEITHAARRSRAHRDEHAFRLHRWSPAASHPRRPTLSQCFRSGAPKQPTNHQGAARAATHAHSDSTGGVAPRIPTPAGPLRARNLDKRLCVESSEPQRPQRSEREETGLLFAPISVVTMCAATLIGNPQISL